MLNIKPKKESNMTSKNELIDELLKGCNRPEDILGEGGLLKQLTKALVERALACPPGREPEVTYPGQDSNLWPTD